MEQFATAVANNVLREQRKWLTDTFPELFIQKIQDTLLTSTPWSSSGEQLQHKRKLQEFVAQALAPTARLILQQSRQEMLQPVKDWYMSKNTAADPPHVMLQALLTEALTSALEEADAGNKKAVEDDLSEIKGLLKLPRTLQPPSSPLANTELRDGHRTWAYY